MPDRDQQLALSGRVIPDAGCALMAVEIKPDQGAVPDDDQHPAQGR
ncbi:MAG TPA: hypothetical protein VND54_01465 [Candidatus Saccharimonadales bacterium]|nr:hypothetical protein [Candidatus Saccharimonadales bacterium]